jgi:hypothetical protein
VANKKKKSDGSILGIPASELEYDQMKYGGVRCSYGTFFACGGKRASARHNLKQVLLEASAPGVVL